MPCSACQLSPSPRLCAFLLTNSKVLNLAVLGVAQQRVHDLEGQIVHGISHPWRLGNFGCSRASLSMNVLVLPIAPFAAAEGHKAIGQRSEQRLLL